MNISEMSLDTNLLSLGSLLGTSGSAELVRDINMHCGNSTFFGSAEDPFRTGFSHFMQTIAEPIRQMNTALLAAAKKAFDPDRIVPITTPKGLCNIPPSMHLPILYFPPVRAMLEEERIDGFGISPKHLDDGDIYAGVLEDGHVELTSDNLGKDGEYTVHCHWSSDEPELDAEERDAIRETREFIWNFMNGEETEHFDVTDYPNLHC